MKIMKKRERLKWTLIVYGMYAVIIMSFILYFLRNVDLGRGVLLSIILSIFSTVLTVIAIMLFALVCYRLFTKEGREEEKRAQALTAIRKTEKRREREWNEFTGHTNL
jgi:peptidoglycan/LPS O-acetylase OafA/YrhL